MQPSQVIKFYADNKSLGIVNKLHTYKVNNLSDAQKAVVRFEHIGYSIRSAWYVNNGVSQRIK